MVVAKVVDQGFEVIAREKESVRIGHGAGEMKELSLEVNGPRHCLFGSHATGCGIA